MPGAKRPQTAPLADLMCDGGRSRSISFSVVSSPGTPLTPVSATPLSAGWTEELEERLRWAQLELEEHQRRWSEGQEEYLAEVEALLELKQRLKKFARRRSKDHRREGVSMERAARLDAGDSGEFEGSEDSRLTRQRSHDVTLRRRLSSLSRKSSLVATPGAPPPRHGSNKSEMSPLSPSGSGDEDTTSPVSNSAPQADEGHQHYFQHGKSGFGVGVDGGSGSGSGSTTSIHWQEQYQQNKQQQQQQQHKPQHSRRRSLASTIFRVASRARTSSSNNNNNNSNSNRLPKKLTM